MKNVWMKRIVSLVLCFALVLGYLPGLSRAAELTTSDRVADPSTMDSWKELFLGTPLTTDNAGGVWTDKSVFTDASAFADTGISQNETDSFLVALSAIAATMSVTGMSNVPTDTMLILDVSGSMNDNEGNNDVAEELVSAANESIHSLLQTNNYNRVGVVLYAGDSSNSNNSDEAIVILPMGRYTTGDDQQYLSYSVTTEGGGRNPQTTETVSVDSDVVYEGTSTKPTAVSKDVVGATYIQKGLYLAMEQFVASGNSTSVEDTVLGTLNRKPVVVLMSDGAPTLGTTDFTNPGQYNLGNGSSTSAALGFVTQLTAAYVKSQIEAKYNTACLFYTLGLGTDNDAVATSVLNPANSSTAINDFWALYNQAEVGGKVTVRSSGGSNGPGGPGGSGGSTSLTVTKISQTLKQNYVDSAVSVSSNTDLAAGLKEAFQKIVGIIQLQSRYFPTLVSESEDLSGYVSFVDRIGAYMNVTDVKGILINNVLYSGADLAVNFAANQNGGALGTAENPTELGLEMVAAVRARLGLDSDDTARTLIALAYEYGQLSYTSATRFSNYIGWYANAAGEFLGFWHENITTMPEATGNVETDPVYIMKSYGYLGAVDESHGVAASDMMYATVQVRQNIATGEQMVVFAVPAALIPVINYQVTLDQNNDLTGLEAVGAQYPIRLVYEVALDDAIDPFTVYDMVSDEYLAANTDDNGKIHFYTNQYETDNSTGYNCVNTYAYFNPSRQNDQYYYQENTPVYADDQGTPYTGESQPAGTYYRAYTVYVNDNGTLRTEVHYRPVAEDILKETVRAEDGSWYIPEGHVHLNLEVYSATKESNLTGTLTEVNVPFVDTEDHSLGDTGYNFVVGDTLGNNGRLTLTPATGIAITKLMAEGATAPTSAFQFVITNLSDETDNNNYPARVVHADGSQSVTAVQFDNGKATVALNAGETIYIGGMSAGTVLSVTEVETQEYLANTSSVEVTVVAGHLAPVQFINADRGTGNLTVAKEVLHDLGSNYTLPEDLQFQIRVQLTGIGTANAQFQVLLNDGTKSSITTDANGSFLLTMSHDEQITILGLPAGTVATVVEEDPGTGFTASYWEDGHTSDGVVTIVDGATVNVAVMNRYTPEVVYPVNVELSGTKVFEIADGDWGDAEFTFHLQKWSESGWTTIATATVNQENNTFNFDGVLQEQQFDTPGAYYYQVVEVNGGQTIDGITYDATIHTFGVIVSDADMDGRLEISNVISYHTGNEFTKDADGNWQIEISFHNHYNASGCTVVLDVQKRLENRSKSPLVSLAGYQFGLYDANGDLVAVSELSDGVGEARFLLKYELEDEGTHTYTLKEIVPQNPVNGMQYAETTYTVVVKVVDNGDGTTSASIVSIDGVTDYDTPVFENVYTPQATSLNINFVSKALTGRDQIAGEFTFEVRDADGTVVATGTNDAEGQVTFDRALYFDAVGIYFYTVVETGTDGNGIVVDRTVHTVMVTVVDDNGVLKATHSVLDEVGASIVFRNTYTAKATQYTIGGTKVLTGRVLLNEEFTFVLNEADDQGNVLSDGIRLTAKNFTNGSFTFDALTFTEAGTYYYVVSEITSSSASYGIHFDQSKYLVTVTVTDNLKGSLEVTDVSMQVIGGESAEQIVFNNTYIPNPTSAQIPGNKTLEGKVLGGGDFRFELYASDQNWTQGALLETVENGADGSFNFASIRYETAGTWYYLVKEVNGGQTIDGVTYDATVYRIRIDVTDDLVGNLHAQVHVYDDAGVPQQGVEFVNIYTATGEDDVTIEGTKTLNGKDLVDGMFTFELVDAEGDVIAMATNKNGKFEFTMNYGVEDVGKTYTYTVREKNGGQTIDGITYSDAQYTVTVTVSDDGKGNVVATATMVGDLSFVNEYKVTGNAYVTIVGNKTLAGKDLSGNEFTFELYQTDESFTITGDALQVVTNGADGSIRFADVALDVAGTYYFVVLENTTPMENVTFDTARYLVTVVVSDDGKGGLMQEVTYVRSTDVTKETVEQILFANVYTPDPDPVTVEIVVNKTVTNLSSEQIGPDGFNFLLENVTLGEYMSAVSDVDGVAVFRLTFTEADIGKVYTYKLSEVNDGREGVIYSTAVYNITITVTLNEDNTLMVDILNNGADVETVEGAFENIYAPDVNPDTGDVRLSAWIALMALSAGSIVTMTTLRKKEKQDEE